MPSAVERLVGAEVERAQHHRLAAHRFGDVAIGLELLVLARQVLAVQEHELAAEKADALGPGLEHLRHVLGQLDVGVELDRRAVEGGGLGRLQALQLLALEPELRLARAELGEHHRIGIDDHHAHHAVDDEKLALGDGLEGVVQADDGRDAEAARDDGGVRGDAADVGDEAAEAMALEKDHVRGREVVRHHDELVLLRSRGLGEGLRAHQGLQHALDRLLHVGLALAQVRIVDLVEAVGELLHLLHQGPFGVAAPLADERLGGLRQRRIVEDHAVQVEERLELLRCVGRDVLLEGGEILARLGERGLEAQHFGLHRRRRNFVVHHFQPRRGRRDAHSRW